MNKKLHIVSFDIPYPPNYGGIIDIFYKIKEMHKLGIEIYLHTFIYNNKKIQPELEKYCKQVIYYKRKNNFISLFSLLPFRLISRKNNSLVKNLKHLNTPILFEGINTIYPLYKFNLKNSFVRTHNIEDKYFLGLAKTEKNYFKKLFNYLEAKKLNNFEKNLKKATGIFTISPFEQDYFSKKFNKNVHYIPAFHEKKSIINYSKKGDFILFHGDLRVTDNIESCLFLINTYKKTEYKFVIATSVDAPKIINEVCKWDNISISKISSQKDLNLLLQNAHINTLFTLQKTGIKLKLLNTLYNGKFIIANSLLVEDTGLESTCEIADSKAFILQKTAELFKRDFEDSEIEKRIEKLKSFSPENSAKKIVEIIFNQK